MQFSRYTTSSHLLNIPLPHSQFEPNPFAEELEAGMEAASVAYKYRLFTLGNIRLVARCEVHCWTNRPIWPQGPGIVLPEQMPAAIEAIREAIQADEALQKRLKEEAEARGDLPPDFDHVSLRMRSTPFIEMLQRCQQAGVEVVWGV